MVWECDHSWIPFKLLFGHAILKNFLLFTPLNLAKDCTVVALSVTSHYKLELPTPNLSAYPLWHRFESIVVKTELIFQRVWGEDG